MIRGCVSFVTLKTVSFINYIGRLTFVFFIIQQHTQSCMGKSRTVTVTHQPLPACSSSLRLPLTPQLQPCTLRHWAFCYCCPHHWRLAVLFTVLLLPLWPEERSKVIAQSCWRSSWSSVLSTSVQHWNQECTSTVASPLETRWWTQNTNGGKCVKSMERSDHTFGDCVDLPCNEEELHLFLTEIN